MVFGLLININIKALKHEMFYYIKPFYITGLFSFVFFVVDKWMIGLFLNDHFLGVYSIFFQIGYAPFTYLALIFTMFLSPIFFNNNDRDNTFIFKPKDLIIPFIFFTSFVILISLRISPK